MSFGFNDPSPEQAELAALRAENEKLRAEAAEVEHFQRQRAALNLELKTAYEDLAKANARADALRRLVEEIVQNFETEEGWTMEQTNAWLARAAALGSKR